MYVFIENGGVFVSAIPFCILHPEIEILVDSMSGFQTLCVGQFFVHPKTLKHRIRVGENNATPNKNTVLDDMFTHLTSVHRYKIIGLG